MAKKQWYSIEVECIKFNPSLTCDVGAKLEVAKVRSLGLAYAVAQYLETCYKPEYFKITVK